MHLLLAALLTLAMAIGLAGLGDLLGARTSGDRWVRGWTLAWWGIAACAQLAGPHVAVAAGVALLIIGVARSAWSLRGAWRSGLALTAAILGGAWLWLAPPVFYDALVYHLGLPWTWLVNGSFQPIRHDLFSRFPLAGEVVFLIPVSLGLPEAAAGLHWVTFIVALVGVARLARRLGAGRLAWVAPALLLACWHAVYLAGVASVDHLVTLGVLVAAEHVAAEDWPAPERVVGVGLGLALAAAAKYTALAVIAAFLIAGVAIWPRTLRRTLAARALAAALSSFWPVRNLMQTGNPLFPLLWRWLGGTGWTARDDGRYLALVREGVGRLPGMLHGLAHLVVPPDGLGWWVVVALPLVLYALLKRTGSRRPRVWAGLTATLALLIWLVTSQTTRYALPAAALVAALAAAGLGAIDLPAVRWVGSALAITVLLGLSDLAAFSLGTLHLDRLWLGRRPTESWRHQLTLNDPLPAYRACARLLPANTRVLVVGEGRPFGCPLPHHVSSPYDTQEMQELVETAPSPAELGARLRALGWTHLVVNGGELRRLGGPEYRVLRFDRRDDEERWRDFLRGFTSPVWQQGELAILGIHPPRAAPSEP